MLLHLAMISVHKKFFTHTRARTHMYMGGGGGDSFIQILGQVL